MIDYCAYSRWEVHGNFPQAHSGVSSDARL